MGVKIGNLDISAFKVGGSDCSIYLGDVKLYPTSSTDYSKEYLTFVAKESGTFKLSGNTVSYSLDSGSTWSSLASNTNSPTVAAGNKILWKASLTPTYSKGVGRFSSTGQFDVEGNAMSLLYGDNFQNQTSLSGKNDAFKYMFSGCTTVVSAENLVLPATTLAVSCYQQMFYKCTSLTTAPELLATTLTDYCYNNMFYNCSSLNYVKCLATDISATNATTSWLFGVASSGTFVKASSMKDWPRTHSGIPSKWTVKNV